MSLCSCSSCSTLPSSSFKWSESNDSYRLLSSSSITTVSSQFDPENARRNLTSDDDDAQRWPVTTDEETRKWRIEKNISLQSQPSKSNSCILKAVMTKEQIVICDGSSTQSTVIPGKHLSMKVVFHA